ncbi:hypothetical protein [Serinicoccus hydrothermalis]|nr:hypothetical protein [Serinicoccus hydrothermalis]
MVEGGETAAAVRAPGAMIGSVIGLVGGTVFVLVNRGELPQAWSTAALIAWVVLLLVAAWAVLVRRGGARQTSAPHPRAGLIYGLSVLGMLVFFIGGSALLRAGGVPELGPALIALGVGLHFIPFARAFGVPFFFGLGGAVSVVGGLGLVLGLVWTPVAAPAAAVLAGLLMVALIGTAATRR